MTKLIKWLLWSNRFEQRKYISLLQVRNALWVFQGARRRGTKSIRARVRARENRLKPFVRTLFLGTRPSCLPSPGRPFFCTDDGKPNLWLGLPGSPVINQRHANIMQMYWLSGLKHWRVVLYCNQPIKTASVFLGINFRLCSHHHAILESVCPGTKTIPDRASLDTEERWFRRDFCNGAILRRADLQSGESLPTIPDCFSWLHL